MAIRKYIPNPKNIAAVSVAMEFALAMTKANALLKLWHLIIIAKTK
jgi:hypothetical protein